MTCDKLTYNTYKEAIDHINGSATRLKQGFKVYKCCDCKKFHVHSIPKKKMTIPPKEKHKKEYYEAMIARQRNKKNDFGCMAKNQLKPTSKAYAPASQKVISPIQAQILKAIIENGNREK